MKLLHITDLYTRLRVCQIGRVKIKLRVRPSYPKGLSRFIPKHQALGNGKPLPGKLLHPFLYHML